MAQHTKEGNYERAHSHHGEVGAAYQRPRLPSHPRIDGAYLSGFAPNGWDPAAGFPAMAGIVPFLMKDVVLLAVSIYLLKQDVARVIEADPNARVELSEAR